jgi:hypothetical protein
MADINNYFRGRINQFHSNVYAKHTRSNPHRNLVGMSAFDLSEGTEPIVRTLTHELPTSYPTSLTAVGVSNGTGNPQCAPTSTTIKRGETQRTFTLAGTSFKTDVVCLSDLKRAEKMAQAASDFERSINEYVDVWWSDWYRVQNIKMVDNKVSTAASGGLDIKTNTEGNHTDCALPTADLSWDHLTALYWELVYAGIADELAVGRDSKGRPILPLIAGPGIIASLWKGDSNVKEQVKFFDSAKNLQLLGYDGAINGFLPVVDLFPIRYGKITTGIESSADLTEANFLYPTENIDATTGRTHRVRSAYRTEARGGLAEFEVATILGRSVWEAKFEAADPSNFSGMNFKPTNYMGEFQWIGGEKNRTFLGDNDRGNLGYYLADIRCGAKPIYPEHAFSIVTNAKQA